jgi:hypothetical protein
MHQHQPTMNLGVKAMKFRHRLKKKIVFSTYIADL